MILVESKVKKIRSKVFCKVIQNKKIIESKE